MPVPKIVVMTPVKNEIANIRRFLSVCSSFADYIFIDDKLSTDGTREVYKEFPKVTLVPGYDKNEDIGENITRSRLLNAAREAVPLPRIIFSIDADEILAANATSTMGWQTLLKAPPGTAVYVEKADFYTTPYEVVRYKTRYEPTIIVDDGSEYKGKKIHSQKVPVPEYGNHLFLHDIKFLHYGLIGSDFNAKIKCYSMCENIFGTAKKTFSRRHKYPTDVNISDYAKSGEITPTPREWIAGWEEQGIDMTSILFERPSRRYYDALQMFKKYGVKRFWMDNIWDFDWEKCRQYGLECGEEGLPDFPIIPPPKSLQKLCRYGDKLHAALKKLNGK